MLDLTKLIDKYLLGELNEVEQKDFENRLKNDPELRNEIDLQQALMKGIERASLSNDLLKARKGYLAKKLLLKLALVLVIAAGAALFIAKTGTNEKDSELPKKEINTAPDSFRISASSDTIIEAPGGMVFYIPAYAFNTNSDSVDIQIEEALDAASVMMKGLQTFSDSTLLETAGMFKFKASVKGEGVEIKKQITASMPIDEIDQDMMLFQGKEDSLGNVNWVNPQKIENPQLKTVDIYSLNFFPEGFLDVMDRFYKIKGVNKESKRIYYEMSGWCSSREAVIRPALPTESYVDNRFEGGDILVNATPEGASTIPVLPFNKVIIPSDATVGNSYSEIEYNENTGAERTHIQSVVRQTEGDYQSESGLLRGRVRVIDHSITYRNRPPTSRRFTTFDTLYFYNQLADSTVDGRAEVPHCEIDPSRIKAIWNDKFNNTLIATREFEERLQFIFATCNATYLNAYLNNLDKPMWYSDSLCMLSHSGFRMFYERGDGGVDLENQVQAKLNAYYRSKVELYQKVAAETWQQYRAEVLKKAGAYQTRKQEQALFNSSRRKLNYKKELEKNIENAYRQLGKTKPSVNVPRRKAYILPVISNGWYNVDKYVRTATRTRTTLDYTDPFSGKRAVIEYKKITLKITNFKQFDFINAYLLPKDLNSFQRINHLKGIYVKNLNQSFENSVVAVAKKGDQWYWLQIPNAFGKTYDRLMEPINEKVLRRKLSRYNWKGIKDVERDIAFSNYQFNYKAEVKRQKFREKQKQEIAEVIWPCREGVQKQPVNPESFELRIEVDTSVGGDL